MVDLLVSEDARYSSLALEGGCYEGEAGYYTRAKPDKLYKFDYVPLEVRSKYDPYTVWAGAYYTMVKDNSMITFISYTLIILGVMFGILTLVAYNGAKKTNEEESKSLRKK
jgi:hypothetical protein